MNDTQTKLNETKTDKAKQNGTKPDKTGSLSYEIPMAPDEALRCLTKWQKEERKNQSVTAVGYRVNNGMLMVEVMPDGEK